ncbi:MAG: hypothetical protein PHO37_18605 [Kiritimatiellae bacterium]|nr:hypothetical protein [Kiritimatiellia bacterium]
MAPAPYPDGERSLDVVLPEGRMADLDLVKIQIEFNSSPSGCVQVAAGVDGRYGIAFKNSTLTLSETDFIPPWLKPAWDTIKVTVRGDYIDDNWSASEKISVKFMRDSTLIVIR